MTGAPRLALPVTQGKKGRLTVFYAKTGESSTIPDAAAVTERIFFPPGVRLIR